MAPPTSLHLGIIAVMLTVTSCGAIPQMVVSRSGVDTTTEAVFIIDELVPSFHTLDERQCLPGDFVLPDKLLLVAEKCAGKVMQKQVASECASASVLAQFYNCFANSNDLLVDTDGETSFDITTMENGMLSYTDDEVWNSAEANMMAKCKRMSSAKLTPAQQAIYTYICIKWELFSDCDRKQCDEGRLDEAGMLRRTRFLAGDCPPSPSELLDAFGLVTGHTWAECSQGLYTGDDVSQLYAAQVSRVVCLLQDFNDDAGRVNFNQMVEAIQEQKLKNEPASVGLLRLIKGCTGCDPLGSPECDTTCYPDMTAEKFAKCWAGAGVFSCVHQQANQVASAFPETCTISVELD